MATHLERFLSHGSISNTERGKVTGTLWFIDADEPVLLDLEGNCHRDLAGSLLVFERPDPELEDGEKVPPMPPILTGMAGDITGSKKVLFQESIFDNPNAHEPTLVNSLCIEWYDKNGERFVIDSIEFCLYAGEAEWEMDAATEKAQLESNRERFNTYIGRIADPIDDDGDPIGDDKPLDEFAWEERLKESDRITNAYMEALDKFQDLPNQEQLVAAAMGWSDPDGEEADIDWDENAPHGEDLSEFELGVEFEAADEFDDIDEDHPLYQRAHAFSIRLHREAQELGILEPDSATTEGGLTPVQTLVFASMELSAKLAGALNGITSQPDSEPGLVVAWLKRGLPILDRALGAAELAHTEAAAPQEWIEQSRQGLFELRADMLDLIQEYRKQLP